MNFYLLDTHIILWWLTNDSKLPSRLKKIIADPDNILLVSAASIWEMVIKKSLGKLVIPDDFKEVIAKDFELLSITAEHACEVGLLPPLHNDPFDRLLVAQCRVEKIPFITMDPLIARYPITTIS